MAPVDVAFCSCAASLERRNASLTHSNGDVSSGSKRNTSARLSGYKKHLVSNVAADRHFIAARSGEHKDMQRRVDILVGYVNAHEKEVKIFIIYAAMAKDR